MFDRTISDVNKDWIYKDKDNDKDKDFTYNLQWLTQ